MEITEVRIKLMEDTEDRLRAFCSITFDNCFVVRDLKIIEGNSGAFVAMPSRKLMHHCPKCGTKNHLRAKFCNNCGGRTSAHEITQDGHGRAKLYADIAHPINAECREMIQNRVIEEFESEQDRSNQPGYVSKYDEAYDTLDDDITGIPDPTVAKPTKPTAEPTTKTSTEPDPLDATTQSTERRERVDAEHPGPGAPHSTSDEKAEQPSDKTADQQSKKDSGGTDFGKGIFE